MLSHTEKVLVSETGQSHAQFKPGEKREREKGGRESVLKFSSWQALIFHHSN